MSGTKIYWKCDKFAVMKCHARIHTEADRIVKRAWAINCMLKNHHSEYMSLRKNDLRLIVRD